MNEPQPTFEFGPFRLDPNKKLLWRQGEVVALAPKLLDTLLVLVELRARVVTKDELLERVWGRTVVEEGGLARNVSLLRKALGEKPDEHAYIVTVPGKGYRFVADVTESQREPAAVAELPPARRSPVSSVGHKLRQLPLLSAALGVAALAVAALLAWAYVSTSKPRAANPLADAVIRRFTDLPGNELDPAVSADGNLIAFLSDRDGIFDVWVGGIAGGDFINLTRGRFARMHMDQLHTVGFSPDDTLVWFRAFEPDAAGKDVPNIWLIPVTGGAPRRFLDNITHLAWAPDGEHIVYQQFTPGDPLFIAKADGSEARRIFVDEPGNHCHMLAWSPDGRFIYFVRGPHPTRQMDVWRISAQGRELERLTHHDARVGYPTPLGDTLLYTAMTADSTATALYALDLSTRATRRVNTGVEEYPTVASGSGASRDRLVATVSNPRGNLFTVPIDGEMVSESAVRPVELPAANAVSPRLGPDFVLYLSSRHGPHGLWKLAGGEATEIWRGENGGVIGPPSLAPDGTRIAFSVHQQGRNVLYAVRANGSGLRQLAGGHDVLDAGAWSADGKWFAVTVRDPAGSRIYKFGVDGEPGVRLTEGMSLLPVWSPDGSFLIYSESLNGPGYAVRAVGANGEPHALPELWVPRGGDRYRFTPDGSALVLLLEEDGRQNFWRHDLRDGSRRQLTDFTRPAAIRGFDVSPDGRQIIFDRIQDNADIVLIDLAR